MLDLKVSEKQGGGEPEPWYAGIRVQTVTAPERIVQSEFDALQVAGAPKNGKMDFRYQTQLVAPTAAQAIAQFKFALAHGELAGRHLCLRQAINGFIGEAAFTLLPELPPEVALDGRPLVFCNIGEQGRERTPGTHVVTLRSKLSGDLVAYENLASVEAWTRWKIAWCCLGWTFMLIRSSCRRRQRRHRQFRRCLLQCLHALPVLRLKSNLRKKERRRS